MPLVYVIVDALSRLLDITKSTSVLNETTNASLFYIKLKWLNEIKNFLKQDRLRACYLYN
jgi:hypothetical protein